jgi:predicted transposase/invertase (TIGR01784 family)
VKTDPIFYQLFQTLPSTFFELINQAPETANDYQFASVEIKQLAFRIDGVFLPKENASLPPIYFVEVQFQSDKKFYSRFFAEIHLYLDKTELTNNWRSVVIYPSRIVDIGERERYSELLASERVRIIYLDELELETQESIGLGTVKLVVAPESTAASKARDLINLAKSRVADAINQREIVELIETIVLYKFPQKSREEIEEMLGLGDLKQTRVYQEAKLEGKIEAIPFMLNFGLTVEQIAEALGLDVELVRKVAKQSSSQQNNRE